MSDNQPQVGTCPMCGSMSKRTPYCLKTGHEIFCRGNRQGCILCTDSWHEFVSQPTPAEPRRVELWMREAVKYIMHDKRSYADPSSHYEALAQHIADCMPAEPRIETQPQIILSERDQQIVLDAIENPPEPNAALKRAFGAQPEPEERHRAEDAYTISAFDYQRDPVGSRDWELFWRGWRARAGSSLIAEPVKSKLTTFRCDCGRKLLVEGQVIGKELGASPPSSPGAAQTVKKLCGHEFKLKDGYFCELPHGHAGGHEATCPNPQFHQSWPNETAGMCNKCQDEHEGFLDECECKCHGSPGAPQEQK